MEDTVPSPSRVNGLTPPPYHDGLHANELPSSIITPQPDVTVKAIGTQDGRRSSSVAQARFQFKTGNPIIAGDNAAYKRTALDKHPASVRYGFWERDLHQALLAEGCELLFDPRLRVRQHASFDFSTFFAQRFHHGQQFGRARLRGRSKVLGLVGTIAAITLVPPLLMARTTTRAISARHPLGNILAALPALVAFATAWSAGEAIGYLKYAAGDRPEATA